MQKTAHPLAVQLRSDFDYERSRWQELTEKWKTDWTKFTEFIQDVFGVSPSSRLTGGGKAPDDSLRLLLRHLPVDQRMAVEWEYKLWVGSSYDELQTRPILAYALRVSEETLAATIEEAISTLREHRDAFLIDLAQAQADRALRGRSPRDD